MPTFIMPDGQNRFEVTEDLLLRAHGARDPGNNSSLLLDPSVVNYNYDTSFPIPQAHKIMKLNLSDIRTDFTTRLKIYDDDRLCSILTAMYGGTNLPPVSVSRTFAKPVYKIENGYHRLIGSIIMGFHQIPCVVPELLARDNTDAPKYIPRHLRNKN